MGGLCYGWNLGATASGTACFGVSDHVGFSRDDYRAIRRFGNTQEATLRMRQVRLSVSNQAIIDADRRLIVVRRDDVEHVLLIGGGHNDLVVERSIVRDWPPAPSDGDRLLQTEPTCQAPRSADLTVEDAVDFPLQPDAEPSTRSLRDILRSLPDEWRVAHSSDRQGHQLRRENDELANGLYFSRSLLASRNFSSTVGSTHLVLQSKRF